jgi:SagB-type dehydrogenase family enzyme
MNPAFTLALKNGVARRADGSDILLIDPPGAVLRWRKPSPGWRQAIDRLAGAGARIDDLAVLLAEHDGRVAWPELYYRVDILGKKALLSRSLAVDGRPLATLHPMSFRARFGSAPFDCKARYRLSRFAVLQTEERRWILVTPLGHAKLLIHEGRILPILARLAEPAAVTELREEWPELAEDAVAALLSLLLEAGAAGICDEAGDLAEDGDIALRQWEPLDLLFHSRSRAGRHDNGFGGTFRFLDRIDPLPAAKAVAAGALVPLPKPDLERLRREDPPFAAVVEARRSIRDYADRRLTVEQLGEFLYRAARVRALHGADRERGRYYAFSQRPYPGGGAVYELELYLAVAACEGLEPGLYRYDPVGHGLVPVSELTDRLGELLENARRSAAAPARPPVLVTLTARFQRFAWKYQSMAYATILKDVGVLYHQLYLNATVMGLAPCGLGGGDSDLFAETAGLDYYRETSVGEFMLGGSLLKPNSGG